MSVPPDVSGFTQCGTQWCWGETRFRVSRVVLCRRRCRRLHDADAAIELALGVVVVDVGVGVAAAHVGRGHRRQAADVVGAAVLQQDVGALLAAGTAGVGQRRLTTGIPTLHVHAVLRVTVITDRDETSNAFTSISICT